MIMSYRCTIALLFLILPLGSFSQQREYNHQIHRVFPISNAATIDITNKYGMVQVLTWDKDSVSFVIDLQIEARDNKRLEKLKEDIDFDFRSGQYFLIAQTVIGDGSSDIIQDLVDIASTYFATANKVTINYTVTIPEYSPIKIENKYGDVYIDDLNGNLNLDLSFGDLKSNQLNGKTEIKINSGDADVFSIRDGQVSVSYSDVQIEQAGELFIESRSSNVTIDQTSDLRIDSRRDKMFLGETGTLSGESYFSDINLDMLSNRMDLRLRYGNLIMERINNSFSYLNLTSEYTDLELAFERPLNFDFELTHHQDIRFIYPQSLARLETAVVNEEEKQMALTGSFGAGSTGSRVIIIASKKCDLFITSR